MSNAILYFRKTFTDLIKAIPEVITFVSVANLPTHVIFPAGDEESAIPSIRCYLTDTPPFITDAPDYLASSIQIDCVGSTPNSTIIVANAVFQWFASNGMQYRSVNNIIISGIIPLSYVRLGTAISQDMRGVYVSTLTLQCMWRGNE